MFPGRVVIEMTPVLVQLIAVQALESSLAVAVLSASIHVDLDST